MVTAVKSKRKNFFLSYGYFHCWLLKNDLYVVDLLNFLKFNKNSSNCWKLKMVLLSAQIASVISLGLEAFSTQRKLNILRKMKTEYVK